MLCRKKLSPLRRRVRKITAVSLAVVITLTAYFELAVKAQLRDVIVRDMLTLSEQAVTAAVDEYLAAHSDMGEKLCRVVYNNGSAAAVTTDPAAVNAVKTAVTKSAQANIDELSRDRGAGVRLGSFTGLVFLMDTGPLIHFPVESSQTVSCEFKSRFESAGVNQTVHHITMTVYVELYIYSPFRIGKTVSTSSAFEIAQTVIVGSVPSYGGVVSY